jgi:hypothetical protein
MEMEADAMTTGPGAAVDTQGSVEAAMFGTRRSGGRPHSISLRGAARSPARRRVGRALDFLAGFGVGAAVMYYLGRRRDR